MWLFGFCCSYFVLHRRNAPACSSKESGLSKSEELEKNPPRPQLRHLSTGEDIQKWLPSIKRDMRIALSQTQVGCYTEDKVKEYRQEVDRLHREYMAFVRKLKSMNPNAVVTPWTSRGYTAKRVADQLEVEDSEDPQPSSSSQPKRLALPIMEHPLNQPLPPVPTIHQPVDQDEPLEFTVIRQRNYMDLEDFAARSQPEKTGREEQDLAAMTGGNDEPLSFGKSKKLIETPPENSISDRLTLVADYSSSSDDAD